MSAAKQTLMRLQESFKKESGTAISSQKKPEGGASASQSQTTEVSVKDEKGAS